MTHAQTRRASAGLPIRLKNEGTRRAEDIEDLSLIVTRSDLSDRPEKATVAVEQYIILRYNLHKIHSTLGRL